MSRRLLITSMILCLALSAFAVRARTGHRVVRLSDGSVLHMTRSSQTTRSLGQPLTQWDAAKTYHLPVVLMSFSDRDFSREDVKEYYDRLFNEPGFNLRHGPGCVADYFRDQSNGLFKVSFDVVGPIQVDYAQKTSSNTRYGSSEINSAVKKADELMDFAKYDWDGDGRVETVIIVYAGYGGNETKESAQGCIWPNTAPGSIRTADGVTINGYSASPELWSNDAPCGIGTICHEFSHVLGLPDFYPTGGDEFSVLDEWDLMDGGNYADDGWCPPNYSIHEREYLGWQKPEELTTTQTVTDMVSLGRGGKTYRIVNEANASEYYLLENRQWEGWDMMLPGHGLLITHVDFRSGAWTGNSVNTSASHHRLEYLHADNLDYNYFEDLYGGNEAYYDADGRNLRMQHTAYPYTDSLGVVHDALTDSTTPAATVFQAREDGSKMMGKPVKDIQERDGVISFQFYESVEAGIRTLATDVRPVAYYDLLGRPVGTPSKGIYIVRYNDGSTKKIKCDE